MAESDVISESPEELNSQKCPSLQQMWKTLKRIEDNSSKLLEDNKNLKASLEFSQAEIKELKLRKQQEVDDKNSGVRKAGKPH